MGGDNERIDDMNVRLRLTQRAGCRDQLLERPTHVCLGDCRCPIADRIDPEDAIVACEQPHEVRSRQRIAAPIVAEAQDVPPPEHVGPRAGPLGRWFQYLHVEELPRSGRLSEPATCTRSPVERTTRRAGYV